MGRASAVIAIGWVGLSAACGGAPESSAANRVVFLRGLRVEVASNAPFVRAPDLDARLESTIDAALQYWGGTWALLDHHTVRIVDAASVDCGGTEALGCVDGDQIQITTRDPGVGTEVCIEQTVLVHEIGHLVLGDPDHTDPRWMEMDPLAAELSGRVGYADGGTVPCETYLSVWRHPLGTP